MKQKRNCGLFLVLLATIACAGCKTVSSVSKNQQGVQKFTQTRYEEAIRLFQESINLDHTNADAHYNLASAYHKLGLLHHDRIQLQLAESHYNSCLDYSDDNHPECYKGLVNLLDQTGRFDDAVQLLEHWRGRYPTSIEPNIQLAYLYDTANQHQTALNHLLQAYSLDRNNSRVLAALGFLRERQGYTDQAIMNYRQSLDINREQPEVSARLAALETRQTYGQYGGNVAPGPTVMR